MPATTKVSKATQAAKVLVIGAGAKATIGDRERAAIAKHATCTALSLTGVVVADLSCVTALPKLQSLELYRTRIADWSALAKVTTLRELFVNGIRDPEALGAISSLTRLVELSILHLPTLTALPDLSRLTSLRSLRLWSCKRLADVTALAKLPARCTVDTLAIPVSDEDIDAIRTPPQRSKVVKSTKRR